MDAEGFDATSADVDALIREHFRPEEHAEVRRELEQLGTDRLRVAVLMNARGDWESLAENLELARIDWRDVLVRAFYPDA